MTEQSGSYGRREYGDYEELGRKLEALREVWVGSDGFSYDGERLFAYSRGGEG